MKTSIKNYVLTAAVLLSINVYESKAQAGFSGGIIGGLSMGSVEINDLDQNFSNNIEGNLYGFEAGLYAKLKLSPFYVKPMALYNFRSGTVDFRDASNSSQNSDVTIHKIEVPVMLGINVVGPLNIEAGPAYNYLLSVTDQYNSQTVNLGRNGIGYRAGANLEFGGVMVGLSYQGAFYSSGSGNATFYEPYKIILGVGIRLGGAGDE